MRAYSEQEVHTPGQGGRTGRHRTDGNVQTSGNPQTTFRREGSVAGSKPRMRGNNRYGTKGREKCNSCRRLKRACEFQNPKDTCDLCRVQGRPCGEKLLKSQEHDLSPPEVEVKQEPEYEIWDEKVEWFPKIQKHTACTKQQIMDKLSKEYSVTESSPAPSHPVGFVSQGPPSNVEKQYMENPAPSTEIQTYGALLNQQFTAQQNGFHNSQQNPYNWLQPHTEFMQIDPNPDTHSNLLRTARNHSMPSLAPPAALETRVSVNSNYNVIDPQLLSIRQPPMYRNQYIYDTNSGQMDQSMRY